MSRRSDAERQRAYDRGVAEGRISIDSQMRAIQRALGSDHVAVFLFDDGRIRVDAIGGPGAHGGPGASGIIACLKPGIYLRSVGEALTDALLRVERIRIADAIARENEEDAR